MKDILLIGCGAMGRAVMRALAGAPDLRVRWILTRPHHAVALRGEMGNAIEVIDSLDALTGAPDIALECAGHEAVTSLVPVLLGRGVRTIIASVGALANAAIPISLERAAKAGRAQLILVPGAIGGIDALSAAREYGLDAVSYIGRKPPRGWLGSPADTQVDLGTLCQARIIFEGRAREAARLYPRNANVAAIVALAGLGMDRTRVTLVADPAITRNSHTISASGAFGDLEISISACALSDNPKTSALAAMSIVRAVRNQVSAFVV
jgi:aspartate dehydrogenase